MIQYKQETTTNRNIVISSFSEEKEAGKLYILKFSRQNMEIWSGSDINTGTIVKWATPVFDENKPSEIPDPSQFMLCIENSDCEDLEKQKSYQILPDEEAARDGYLRVVDESQEDYLYPASYFILPPVSYFIFTELPSKTQGYP